MAVIDVSFISLALVLPPVARCILPPGRMLALVKPQFEVGRGKVGKGGIVRDPALHREVLERMVAFARERTWGLEGVAASPIRGAEGNVEFFLHLTPGSRGQGGDRIEEDLERALETWS
jgi:23S rRNA (cytidine1920-2'-O)/16S rRNA (cytidine1409-2'-O)-methyltransferase